MMKPKHSRSRLLTAGLSTLAVSLLLLGCSQPIASAPGGLAMQAPVPEPCVVAEGDETFLPGDGDDDDIGVNPEASSGYRSGMEAVEFADYGIVTANPTATLAGCRVLEAGGSAADALIAAQVVLGLVEPQSSGLGGGAFVVYYDAATGETTSYDARETAPAAATENYLRWISDDQQTAPQPNATRSGRSIGVPGTVRLLETLHDNHGALDWADKFQAGIRLAENGFSVGDRLSSQVNRGIENGNILLDENMTAYFVDENGNGPEAGSTMTNPAYADTLRAIVAGGADAFYTGDIAQSIIDSTTSDSNGRTPGAMTLEDLASYEVIERPAICHDYRDVGVCGMPAPSSGGLTVAQTLMIIEQLDVDLSELGPDPDALDGGVASAQGIHYISEAMRLAYADRNAYMADTDFVDIVPGGLEANLLDPDYVAERAALIDPDQSMGTAQPGDFDLEWASYEGEESGTSHISAVDAKGNVASMTTTIEGGLGSYHMTSTGFLLNNELTDFSANPGTEEAPIANKIEPNKRPRSSMAPTILYALDDSGNHAEAIATIGSPGGAVIIQYVITTIIGLVDWDMDPQAAVSMAHFGSSNSATTAIDGAHPLIDGGSSELFQNIRAELMAMGHTVAEEPGARGSGLGALIRTDDGWIGGADPRREGVVMGGAVVPDDGPGDEDGGDDGDDGDGDEPDQPRKPERVDTDI